MRNRPPVWKKSFIVSMIVVVLMGVLWFTFAPIQFGGQAAYAIISGNSMEPLYHRGDLVVLRQAVTYQIGDIATYYHPEVGPIIHRIVDRQGDQFVFKGDHNDSLDTYQPTAAEIIGKAWLHLPSVGSFLAKLRSPWILSGLVFGMGLVVLAGSMGGQTRSPRQHRRVKNLTKEPSMMGQGNSKIDILFLLGVAALASLLLAVVAFMRSPTQTVPATIKYEQNGVFNYSAAAPPGVYASDTVQTGQPIFRQLINQVTVNFDYQHLVSGLPANVGGTYRLVAEVSHRNGWRWTIDLRPETQFNGGTFSTSATLDLNQIQAIIDNLERQTGLTNQQYLLSIGPEVNIAGTLSGQFLNDHFSPRLTFTLDDTQMQLKDSGLTPSQTGTISYPREEPNTLSLFGLKLNILAARLIGVIGLMLAGLGMVVVFLPTLWTEPGNQAAQWQAKYGTMMVKINNADLGSHGRILDVNTFEDLVKIADRLGGMVLEQNADSIPHYFVQNGEILYRYRFINNQQKANAATTQLRPDWRV